MVYNHVCVEDLIFTTKSYISNAFVGLKFKHYGKNNLKNIGLKNLISWLYIKSIRLDRHILSNQPIDGEASVLMLVM